MPNAQRPISNEKRSPKVGCFLIGHCALGIVHFRLLAFSATCWGTRLSYGKSHLLDAPHLAVFPGIAIAVLVLGFNFLGDGLRDALDPTVN
jgi:ABC-type dipeptide/oligopeptide/nickel transport system permease subunit